MPFTLGVFIPTEMSSFGEKAAGSEDEEILHHGSECVPQARGQSELNELFNLKTE